MKVVIMLNLKKHKNIIKIIKIIYKILKMM